MSERGRLDYGTSEGVKSAVTLKLPRWNGKSAVIPSKGETNEPAISFGSALARSIVIRRRRSAPVIDQCSKSKDAIGSYGSRKKCLISYAYVLTRIDLYNGNVTAHERLLCGIVKGISDPVLVGYYWRVHRWNSTSPGYASVPMSTGSKRCARTRTDTPTHSCLWKPVHLPGSPVETIRHKL